RPEPERTTGGSENEFSCHCCYDILVNPTTLTCGHNFCRHCLALWWESSRKNECPECRQMWEGFPKINIMLRLLLMLEDEDLVKPPFNIEKQTHRRAVLAELERVKALGVKPPQNLWEYKAANAGKSLFLLYGLKHSPRLTIFYLYLFDYSETFLPFLHTCCPLTHIVSGHTFLMVEPSWQQWGEFLVKYFLLPYQLIAEFAWDWLAVHYWTSRFIIVNAMLLTMLEAFSLWRLWTTAPKTWIHLCKMLYLGFAFALVWSFIPQFVCNCFFYWALYFSPIINIDLVVQQLMHPETRAR
uniref:RING-type domain-containing protein n=1 Tax=Xiphophorus couchianus TaxID=32473 RepID=A0A3B5MJM5_9TELE